MFFYNLGFKENARSPIRAPTWPEKNPPEPEKIFIYEEIFFISEVEMPDYEQNKRRETPCLGLSPLR